MWAGSKYCRPGFESVSKKETYSLCCTGFFPSYTFSYLRAPDFREEGVNVSVALTVPVGVDSTVELTFTHRDR